MKKILAVVLALMLAFSCTAMAEEAVSGVALSGTITFDAAQVNSLAAMFGLGEEYQPIINIVLSILNNLGGRVVVTREGMQADVLLKDGAVATIVGGDYEDGIAFVSDLFPNYVITVTAETLQPVMEAMEQTMSQKIAVDSLDLEAVAGSAAPAIAEFTADIYAHLGEPEVGEYPIDGYTFNVKVPLNMTAKELSLSALKLVKSLMDNEEVAAAVAALSSSAPIDLSELDEAAAKLEATDDADWPQITADIYYLMDAEGNSAAQYVAAEIVDGEETTTITGGRVDNVFKLNMVSSTMQVALTLTGDENSVSLGVDVYASGMYIGLGMQSASVNGVMASEMDIFFLNKTAP